jgi:hypothetical protein
MGLDVIILVVVAVIAFVGFSALSRKKSLDNDNRDGTRPE